MQIDLALSLFDADLPTTIATAAAVEDLPISGIWVADHFSGAVVGRSWSRDPFVALGAIAQVTSSVRVGPLVANVRNRHAAQLASATNSLASLAPGRTVLGIGSGAAPGSRFAVEHDAVGTELGDAESRRARLVEHITAVRSLHDANRHRDPRLAVTDGASCPPIVVGASAASTVDVAVEHADGVNLRSGPRLSELVQRARRAGSDFEVSVLEWFTLDPGEVVRIQELGVDRLVVGVDADRSIAEIESRVGEIAAAMSAG